MSARMATDCGLEHGGQVDPHSDCGNCGVVMSQQASRTAGLLLPCQVTQQAG